MLGLPEEQVEFSLNLLPVRVRLRLGICSSRTCGPTSASNSPTTSTAGARPRRRYGSLYSLRIELWFRSDLLGPGAPQKPPSVNPGSEKGHAQPMDGALDADEQPRLFAE